jgi:phosphopantothenoylcysteine synthetase/decarboxylase
VEAAWLPDLHSIAESTLRHSSFDAVAHAMAVLDYAPQTPANRKTRSGLPGWTVTLEPTPKLLPRLREWYPLSFFVGFKLLWSVSQEQLRAAAQELLSENKLQLVAANDLSLITGDSHPAILVNHTGVIAHTKTKGELARVLVDAMCGRFSHE